VAYGRHRRRSRVPRCGARLTLIKCGHGCWRFLSYPALGAPAPQPRGTGRALVEEEHGMRDTGDGMGQRDWVKSVGKKLREDMGDCPTLPQEMLNLLSRLRTEEGEGAWGRGTSRPNESGRGSRPREASIINSFAG
jgi:hypothetical protein